VSIAIARHRMGQAEATHRKAFALLLAATLLVAPILAVCPGNAWADGDPATPEGFEKLRGRAGAEAPAQPEAAQPAAPKSESEKVLDDIRKERKHRSVSMKQEMEINLFLAKRELKAGEHENALQRARRVLASAKHLQDTGRARSFQDEAGRIAAEAQTAIEKGRAERRQTELVVMKKKAASQRTENLAVTKKRGWEYYDRGEYEKALEIAEQMLLVDADSKQGIYLKQEASRALGRLDDMGAVRADIRKSQNALLHKQIEEEMIVPEDIDAKIVLASDEVDEERDALLDRSLPAWERQLRRKLSEKLDTEFKGATLVTACRHLSQISDAPIMIDPLVAKCTTPIDLPQMDVTFEHWLKWIGMTCNVTYTLSDHAILITRGGGLLDRPVTREYDIAGLLVPSSIEAVAFNGATQRDNQPRGRGAFGDGIEIENRPETKEQIGNNWSQFIRSTVEPDSWGDALQEEVPYSINYRNGRIVVVQTPEVHEQIERLLNNFRKARNLQVHIMARFIEMDLDYLQSINVDVLHPDDQRELDPPGPARYGYESLTKKPWTLVGDMDNQDNVAAIEDSVTAEGGLHMNYAYLGEDELHVLLDAVLKRRRGTLLLAPKLTCFNTQRANFQAVTNYNYVRTISADNEPEIGNVPDGIIFDVQPFVSADRRTITLVLQPQLRTLLDMPSFAYVRPLGSGQFDPTLFFLVGTQRSVQVPVVQLKSIASTITVPDGGTLLLGGLATSREVKGYASAPFIAHLPVVQYLLRDWTEVERRVSLVVLVTAQIVKDVFEE